MPLFMPRADHGTPVLGRDRGVALFDAILRTNALARAFS